MQIPELLKKIFFKN